MNKLKTILTSITLAIVFTSNLVLSQPPKVSPLNFELSLEIYGDRVEALGVKHYQLENQIKELEAQIAILHTEYEAREIQLGSMDETNTEILEEQSQIFFKELKLINKKDDLTEKIKNITEEIGTIISKLEHFDTN